MDGGNLGETHRANSLIFHKWEPEPNKPWEFHSREDIEKTIPASSVLFHRCKNASLIETLRKERKVSTKVVKAVREFFAAPEPEARSETAILQLGRYGDIINVLPIARDIAKKQGGPIDFIVSKEYAGVLTGCSFVNPLTTDAPWYNPKTEAEVRRADYNNLIQTQVWGQDYQNHRKQAEPHKE